MRSIAELLHSSDASRVCNSGSAEDRGMYTVQQEFIAVTTEQTDCFQLRIMKNPSAILLTVDNELWLYWHAGGNRTLSGWYFYFESPEGRHSQLFGPFY